MKIRIGNRIVDAELKDGVPTIKADVEQVQRPDGTIDVIVKVPCMELSGGTDGQHDIQ